MNKAGDDGIGFLLVSSIGLLMPNKVASARRHATARKSSRNIADKAYLNPPDKRDAYRQYRRFINVCRNNFGFIWQLNDTSIRHYDYFTSSMKFFMNIILRIQELTYFAIVINHLHIEPAFFKNLPNVL